MIRTDPTKYQTVHQLFSLPKIPPPTAAKKTPIKKDIEANSPFVITVRKNMTSPITIKVTVYGMTVCTFSIYLPTQKSALLPPFPSQTPPPPPLPHLSPNACSHTPLYISTYTFLIVWVQKRSRRPRSRLAR